MTTSPMGDLRSRLNELAHKWSLHAQLLSKVHPESPALVAFKQCAEELVDAIIFDTDPADFIRRRPR